MSLRWRLTLGQLILLAFVLTGFALVSYRFLANGLATETDKVLQERARHVLEAVHTIPTQVVEEVAAPTDEFASPGIYVQVLTAGGQVLAQSDNLGRQRLPVNQQLLAKVLAGQALYTTETVEMQKVRLYHQPMVREGRVIGVVQVGQSMQSLESTLRRLQTIYLVSIAGALVVGGMVSWFLIRLGLRPIVQMSHTTERIAQSGDMQERLAYVGPQDEIGHLASTFNLMMKRLETAFDAQRRFVADTAHELRTPLATILGNVDLLVRYGEDPQRRRQALASIKREGERTARLAAHLLLLAQADVGQKLQLRPMELDEVVLEVYEQAQTFANSTSILLNQCQFTPMLGDPDRLKQVLLNLIDNALKYTDPPGRVSLSLACEGDQAVLTISDTGRGIPVADLPHVFERFYRVGGTDRDGGSSTGLGLSIVKWIVEEHGGAVIVDSAIRKGSTFTVRLPTWQG